MKTHKNWKGCCMLCAWARETFKGNSKDTVPWRAKRQLGRKRRNDA